MAKQPNKMLLAISRYGNKLKGFIRNRVSSTEDAEDILQEVWFQLSRIVDLDEIENLNAWLFRVARNKITDTYRKQASAGQDQGLEDLDFLVHEDLPDDEHFRALFWDELFAALEALPEKQRDVFVKNELEDMTLQEIADASDESIKTIISRKRYAVQQLRTRLQPLYDELTNT